MLYGASVRCAIDRDKSHDVLLTGSHIGSSMRLASTGELLDIATDDQQRQVGIICKSLTSTNLFSIYILGSHRLMEMCLTRRSSEEQAKQLGISHSKQNVTVCQRSLQRRLNASTPRPGFWKIRSH